MTKSKAVAIAIRGLAVEAGLIDCSVAGSIMPVLDPEERALVVSNAHAEAAKAWTGIDLKEAIYEIVLAHLLLDPRQGAPSQAAAAFVNRVLDYDTWKG